jgi:hypothetical protein
MDVWDESFDFIAIRVSKYDFVRIYSIGRDAMI